MEDVVAMLLMVRDDLTKNMNLTLQLASGRQHPRRWSKANPW